MPFSPAQRLALKKHINSLVQADFDDLVFALDVPLGIIPSGAEAQGNRSSIFLQWVEGPTGCGMEILLDTLNQVAPIPGDEPQQNQGFQQQKRFQNTSDRSVPSIDSFSSSDTSRLSPILKSQHDPKSDTNSGGTVSTPTLEQPEGQVPLKSSFYVERPPIEQDCYETIVKSGALIRVKAARQMGKTSLMSRILAHGRSHNYRAVPLYFQEADDEVFSDLKACLQWFCTTIAEELGLSDDVEEFWEKGRSGNKRKCTNYLQQHVLSKIESPLVLGLDEVDLVFQHLKIAKDFFALLRTWHERGKNELQWQKLRLVIVHSKEVYIPLDMHQSPFNVGLPIELPEFSPAQLQTLAERHGLTLTETDIQKLATMVGGHPYLVRVALYELVRGRRNLTSLLEVAPTEEGPYDDHLRRHLRNLTDNPNLVTAMGQIIESDGPTQIGPDEAFQLRSMGLVKMQGNTAIPLCDLYRHYFLDRLRT